MTSFDFGRATEARFVMDAHLHGHVVSRPFTEAPGYDVLVDNGKRIFRVQVKGARPNHTRRPGATRPAYDFSFSSRRNFDVFAGWLDGENTWIIVHSRDLPRSACLRVSSTSSARRHLGAWRVFEKP